MADLSSITVDAVREQLRLLGHHDVPDEIISQVFLPSEPTLFR